MLSNFSSQEVLLFFSLPFPSPLLPLLTFFFIAQYCSFDRWSFFFCHTLYKCLFSFDDLLHFFIPPPCCFLIITTFRYSTNSFGYIHDILAPIILTFQFLFCIFHHPFHFFVFQSPQFHFSRIFQLSNSSMLHR